MYEIYNKPYGKRAWPLSKQEEYPGNSGKSVHILSAFRGCEIFVNILLDRAHLVAKFPSVNTLETGWFSYIFMGM